MSDGVAAGGDGREERSAAHRAAGDAVAVRAMPGHEGADSSWQSQSHNLNKNMKRQNNGIKINKNNFGRDVKTQLTNASDGSQMKKCVIVGGNPKRLGRLC